MSGVVDRQHRHKDVQERGEPASWGEVLVCV